MFKNNKHTICNCPTLSLLLAFFLYARAVFSVLFDSFNLLTSVSLGKDTSYILQKNRNARPFQITTEPNERNFTPWMTTQQMSRENKASRVSNLRCGWSCQAISVTSVTLYGPSLERIRCMKSRQSFSRLTRHAYGASSLPKTSENDCFAV